MIQSFNMLLERITERGLIKLSPSEMIDVRLGRSIYQFIHINITFHYQRTRFVISSKKRRPTKFDGFQMWKIYLSFIQIIQILNITVDKEFIQILNITVDKEYWNVRSPNSIEFK